MSGEDPVFADDTFDRVELTLFVIHFVALLAGRVSRYVDVAAVVVEDGLLVRGGEVVASLVVQAEGLSDFVGGHMRPALNVDPKEL